MPIYEYRCRDCGEEFEYQQRMSEDPKSVCESCRGTLERLISRTSFHLKGGGWYKDLYASPKKDSADKGSDKADGGTSSGGEGGTSSTDSSSSSAASASSSSSSASSSSPSSSSASSGSD